MSNFSVRFAYEFFFEICLCVFIHVNAFGAKANLSDFLWALALLLLFVIIAMIVLIGLTFWCGGPYSPTNSYAPKSILNSFWGMRPLSDEMLQSSLADIQKNIFVDS